MPALVPVPEPVPGPGTIFGRLFLRACAIVTHGPWRPAISSLASASTCARAPLPSCAPSHSRSFKRLDDAIHYAFTLFIPSDGSASFFAKFVILCNDTNSSIATASSCRWSRESRIRSHSCEPTATPITGPLHQGKKSYPTCASLLDSLRFPPSSSALPRLARSLTLLPSPRR